MNDLQRRKKKNQKKRKNNFKKRTKKKTIRIFYEWKERRNISLKIPNKRTCHSREKG